MICEFTLFAPLTTPTQTCLSSMCLPPPHALLLQPHVLEFARVCKFPSFLALRKSGLRPRRIAAIFSDDRFFWVCLCLSIRVSARWLWERVPEAVRSDEDMSRIWEVAKLLRNGDMQPAYAQLANAGTAFVSPFPLFWPSNFQSTSAAIQTHEFAGENTSSLFVYRVEATSNVLNLLSTST